MLRYFLALLTCVLLVSCQNKQQYTQTMRYHDDGRSKPMVTVVPMMDSSCYEIPWSISEEFTTTVKDRLASQGNIFIHKNDDIHLSNDNNPFGTNINWVKSSFKPTEFVVFLELIEHEDVSILLTAKDPSKVPESRRDAVNLNMAMRLRIVDIRGDSPKVVLQEMINDSYYIANNINKTDYNLTNWGSDEYATSPMGVAHTQFSKQIIERVNDYIMLAKSR